MPETFDPYYEWLAIRPEQQPANHYQLLGIPLFEANRNVIENAADQRMGHLRVLASGQHAAVSQQVLNEVAKARVCLLNGQRKATYDAELRGRLGMDTHGPVDDASGPSAKASESPNAARGTPFLWWLAGGGAAAVVSLIALGWWLTGDGRGPHGTAPRPAIALGDAPDTIVAPPPPPPPLSNAPRPVSSVDLPPQGASASVAFEEMTTPATEAARPAPSEREPAKTEAVASGEPGELVEPMHVPTPELHTNDSSEEDSTSDDRLALADVRAEVARAKVPDRAAQQEILRLLDDAFHANTAREPDEKLALSKELAAMAEKAHNADERFVLLRRASELASEAGDVPRMLNLVTHIAEQYEVDRLTAQAGMLSAFAKGTGNTDRLRALMTGSATVIDTAMAAERFDLAESLAETVHRACSVSAGRPFRVEALRRRREAQALRERWDAVQEAKVVLESDPGNEAANTTVGRWYGPVRGEWEKALPYLARSSDPALKPLAQRELEAPPAEPGAQVELADAWWDRATAIDREWQAALLERAAYWYRLARPELDSPILAAKVAKRLEEFAKLGLQASEPLEKVAATTPGPDRTSGRRDQPVDIGIENPSQVPVGKVREHKISAEVRQLAATADGRRYAAVGWGAGLTCWETGTGEVVVKMPLDQTLYGVALSPDGRFAICGGQSRVLHVLDLEAEKEVKAIPIAGWQFAQALSRDGKHLLVGTDQGPRLWDVAKGVEMVRLQGSGGWVEDVCFSGDERFIGTASTDRTARVHLLPTGQEVSRFAGHRHHVRSIALSPNGRLAISGGDDKMARLWEVATGRELHRVEHQATVYGVAFTENGRYGVSTGGDLQMWDATNGRQVARFELAGTRLTLLADNRFAVTSRGAELFLWRLPLAATGQAFEGTHEESR